MNITDYLKFQINDKLYGGNNWRNDAWKSQYINQLMANINNQPQNVIDTTNSSGNLYRYSIRGGSEMPDVEKETGIYIKDTFINYNTNSMLFGKKITPYAKKIVFEVIKFYNDKNSSADGVTKQKIIKYLNKVFEDKDLNYDKLMEKFSAKSNECLLAYMLIAYQNNNLDLMLRTTYTFGRVLPLTYKNEWFDNYRLNAYGNVLNMIMWKEHDCKDTFTIDESPREINMNVSLTNPTRVLKFLVGSLRAFIVKNNLYPNQVSGDIHYDNFTNEQQIVNEQKYNNEQSVITNDEEISNEQSVITNDEEISNEQSVITNDEEISNEQSVITNDEEISNEQSIRGGAKSKQKRMNQQFHEIKSMQGGDLEQITGGADDLTIIDEAYKHYPFYFGGAHGCDVFDISNMSLSLNEITEFLNRYPSARVGYILNTATYKSGHGEHWVALELTHGKARLICSQQSDFSVFHDGGKLRNTLRSLGYGEEWNNKEIQTENYGCGTYAFISLMELLRFGNIDKAVNAIGVNMENLGKDVNKTSNVDIVREKLVGFTSSSQK